MSIGTRAIARTTVPSSGQWLTWLPIIAGLLILYVPSLLDLSRTTWASDEQKHGPIVLSIACWLAWRKWPGMWQASDAASPSAWGWGTLSVGLLLYVVGRSQDILLFEIASLIPMLAGLPSWCSHAASTLLKAQWFPLFFMLFMIPLPGIDRRRR
jgi:hypothetical protein